MQARNFLLMISQKNINDTGKYSPRRKQNVSRHRGGRTTTPSTSNWTPPTPFSVKYIHSAPLRPSLCTNGWKNNLPKDISNHPNPHTQPVPSVSKRRMGLTAQYKTTDLSTTGQSETNIRSPTLNTLPRNFRGICYSLDLIFNRDITMSTFVQETNGKLPSVRQKDTGNPKSCTSDNATHLPLSSESLTNSYNPSRTNTQG